MSTISGKCSIQAQVVGMVDSKGKLEKLLNACRGITGRVEQKLLHRETVYKLTNHPAAPAGPKNVNYELRYRLGKIGTSEPDKFVQPMSLIFIADPTPLPRAYEKYFQQEAEAGRRLVKPTTRKIVEVIFFNLSSCGFSRYYLHCSREFFRLRSDLHATNLSSW